ncbi:hypothetical protein [Nocardia wallacei]|uniref:hypothetical protein n=1 Tax=Nocardia wallacei TaxID=480035 RepID=UPI002455559A|nr:hypothetical protein [Nocardia wallacei]
MRPRIVAVVAALAVAATVAVIALAQAMQFRTDSGASGSRTSVTFDARARFGSRAEDPALTVWKHCRSIVGHVRLVDGPTEREGDWTVLLEPALGAHTERRFVGCLEDLGVDGIMGRVVNLQRTHA